LPGDVVDVRAQSDDVVTYEDLIVDEEGAIEVPLAGAVRVGGLDLTQAAQRVQEALQQFDRVVRVSLRAAELAGHRATVLGAVADPGVHGVLPGMRLAELVALSDGEHTGLEEDMEHVVLADWDGARLMRGGRALPVDVSRAIQGETRHNVRVRPGDLLYVPPRRGERVSVLGNVGTPRVIDYRDELRLSEALALAGGITLDGDDGDIRVIRGSLAEPRVYEANFDDLMEGEATDVELAPGDVVFVTTHWIADVGEVLDRLAPLLTLGLTVGLTVGITGRE
jgi:polysaccharide export outer membrane protein